jgi:hypothetical protein
MSWKALLRQLDVSTGSTAARCWALAALAAFIWLSWHRRPEAMLAVLALLMAFPSISLVLLQ